MNRTRQPLHNNRVTFQISATDLIREVGYIKNIVLTGLCFGQAVDIRGLIRSARGGRYSTRRPRPSSFAFSLLGLDPLLSRPIGEAGGCGRKRKFLLWG